MAFLRNRGAVVPESGNNSQIIIAEQAKASWTDTAKRVADAYRFQPLITAGDLMQSGEIIPNNYFDGQASQNKGLDGPLDITNGLTLSLSGNGTALFFRMLTQARNPDGTQTALDGTSYSATAVDVVASGATLGTDGSTTVLTVVGSAGSRTGNPVQLEVDLTGASLAPGRAFGYITITGTDHSDRAITEQVSFYSGALDDAVKTNFYFKTVSAASATGFDAGTAEIDGNDTASQVTFTPQDNELVAYWTAELAKGNIPNTYYSLILQSASMSIADRSSVVQFECSFLGRQANVYQSLAGTATRTTLPDTLEFASPDVFPSWRTDIRVGDLTIAATSATLNVNQNLEYTNVLGGRYQESPPLRGDKRSLTVETNVLYDAMNNLSDNFEGNTTLNNVNIVMLNDSLGGFPHRFSFEMEAAQLTVDPDPGIAGFGAIGQTVTFQGISTRRGTPDFRIVADYSDYQSLPDFT